MLKAHINTGFRHFCPLFKLNSGTHILWFGTSLRRVFCMFSLLILVIFWVRGIFCLHFANMVLQTRFKTCFILRQVCCYNCFFMYHSYINIVFSYLNTTQVWHNHHIEQLYNKYPCFSANNFSMLILYLLKQTIIIFCMFSLLNIIYS